MCNTQGPSTPPSWLSYVNVADSNRAVTTAKAAGGRLLHGPVEVPGGSWIALFMDPQGGAFAVQEMPRPVTQAKPASAPPKPAATSKAATAAAPSAAAKPKPAAAPKKKAAEEEGGQEEVAKKKAAEEGAEESGAQEGGEEAGKAQGGQEEGGPQERASQRAPQTRQTGRAGAEGFHVAAARGFCPRGGCPGCARDY